ncbi:MAG TPA: hypothetical protein VFC50_01970, partial [Candidatus Dormibacteraeota bacterium]|nr:hypothetical protein [Candidatus Dormibacteraeota bacterium]
MAEPPDQLPEGDPNRSDIRPDMGGVHSGGEGGVPRDDLRDAEEGGLYNPEDEDGAGSGEDGRQGGRQGGDRGRDKSASPGSLRDSEQSAGRRSPKDSDGEGDGLYNPDDDDGRLAPLRRARAKAQNIQARAMKKKWLVGVAIGSNVIVIGMIILVALIIGGYKAVDFAEHVAAYQFARNTATMAENATSINDEKLGIDSLAAESEDSAASATDRNLAQQLLDKIQAKATAVTGKAKDLWSSFDNYRPGKVISNFQDNNILKFNEAKTRLGRT